MELSKLENLERLAKLRSDDLLTLEEFSLEKEKILNGLGPSNMSAVGNIAEKVSQIWSNRRVKAVFSLLGFAAAGVGAFLIINDFPSQSAPTMATIEVAPRKRLQLLAPKPTPAPSAEQPCRGKTCRVLTPRSWGGIVAGMKVAHAKSVSGITIKNDGHYEGVEGDCRRYEVVGGPPSISLLVEGGRVTSITADGGDFETDRGVKIGDEESKVTKLYKPLRIEPDIYGTAEDKMLFFDTDKGKFGIKFAVNAGKVSSITVGGASREYVKGCL